jgi:hypothetical protein
MAGQACTPTPGIVDYYAWMKEQEVWIKFVKEGGLLSDVPAIHRRDKVCFYASLNQKVVAGVSPCENWRQEILPHIPMDVLFMGFMTGNVGHKISSDER